MAHGVFSTAARIKSFAGQIPLLSISISLNEGGHVAQITAKISKFKTAPLGHDHSNQLKRVARVRGQVDGIERMILAKRYCPEIIQQIKAARSALKALELEIYEGHLKGCVKKALNTKNEKDSDAKIDELIALMRSQS